MKDWLCRREFLASGAVAGVVGVGIAGRAAAAGTSAGGEAFRGASGLVDGVGVTYPTTDPSMALEIVLVSHAQIDRVRELLVEDRALALAAWDWGFGDWESALGAASHMGRRDIAELLIEHGARPTLFTFAMLDQVDVVRAYCEANPGIQGLGGPHGITLLAHARNGKASRVQTYLTELGGANEGPIALETTDEQIESYVGSYRFGEDESEVMIVERNRRGTVGIRREGGNFRRLRRTGEDSFSPGGAPHVTVRFGMKDGRAEGLTIHRGEFVLSAGRE